MSHNLPRKSLQYNPTDYTTHSSLGNYSNQDSTMNFKTLNIAEIPPRLKPFGIEIKRTDLQEQDPKFFIELCEDISRVITGKCLIDFSEISDAEEEILGDLKPYRDSLILLRFSAHMSRIFKYLRYPNFGINDLITPNSITCLKWLTAVVFFLEFSVTRKPQCDSLIEKERELRDEVSDLNLRYESLIDELEAMNIIRSELEKNEAIIIDVKESNNSLHSEQKQKEAISSDVRRKTAIAKEEIKNTLNEANHNKDLKRQVEAQCAHILSILEKNPRHLKDVISKLRDDVDTSANEIENVAFAMAQTKKHKEVIESVIKEVELATSLLSQSIIEKTSIKKCKSTTSDYNAVLNNLEIKKKDLGAEMKALKMQKELKMNRQNDFLNNQLKIQADKSKKIQELNERIPEAEQLYELKSSTQERLNHQKDELEKSVSTLISSTDSTIHGINGHNMDIKDKIASYIEALDENVLAIYKIFCEL